MAAVHYSKFYWSDHCSDPRLALCGLAARGLWVHMQGLAAQAAPFGFVLVNGRAPANHELARLVGAPQDQVEAALDELEGNGVFSRDATGRIYSRRMVRDAAKSVEMRARGIRGGNPQLRREPDDLDNHWDKPELNHEDRPEPEHEDKRSLVEPESRIQNPERERAGAPAGAALSLDFDLPDEWKGEARRSCASARLVLPGGADAAPVANVAVPAAMAGAVD